MRPCLGFVLLGVLACVQPMAPVTLVAAKASAPLPTPTQAPHFLNPPEASPGFADPDRKAKIVAAAAGLDGHFVAYAERVQVPGLAVGLVVDGDLVWAKGYGISDLTTRVPVDLDTLFRIASMTKAFTATAVLELRDEGKLSIETPVEDVLPEMRGIVYPTRDAPRITLRDLLTHSAGLPHDEVLRSAGWQTPTEVETLKGLAGLELEAPPGFTFSYSNLGFALAGAVVSRVSGMPYAQFLTERVLSPLGMRSTSFDPPKDRLAFGHIVHAGKVEKPPPLRLGADPAGGLYSSVRDLAKWASFQLEAWPPRDDKDDGPLKRSSVRETQRIAAWRELRVPRRGVGKEQTARAIGYGFGWITEETCDWDGTVWHNGSEKDGYRSFLLMLPDRGVALFALQNLWEPRYELDTAVREAARLLDAAGALPKRQWTPSPELLAARDAVVTLREKWDDSLATRAFSEALAASLPELQTDIAGDPKDHGACHVTKTTADGIKHVEWELACDHGGQAFQLTIDSQEKIVDIHRDDTFPPEPRLTAAVQPLAGLIGRWDERVVAPLVEAAVDRTDMKSAFAEAGALHSACKVDHVDPRGDKTHGRFALACAHGGPLELRATLDEKTGKLTKVTLGAPMVAGSKCP